MLLDVGYYEEKTKMKSGYTNVKYDHFHFPRDLKLNTLLIFHILILLTSCNGQNSTKITNHNSIVVLGDTVSELSKSIWIVFQTTNGDYWYGSDTDGAYRFDGKTIINFSVKNGLSSNRIRGIQEDKQGQIWLGTHDKGVFKFNGETFEKFTP